MGVDRSRVVRLRVAPSTGEGPPWMFGSGYLVAKGRVLTAAHVLSPPDQEEHPQRGQKCEVLAWPCNTDDWLSSSAEWVDPERDVAVVSLDLIPPAGATVRFEGLQGGDPVDWSAVGFPIATVDASGRQPEQVFGRTSPISEAPAGRLALTVESRQPVDAGDYDSWAGLSGAAVICGEALAGVVTADHRRWRASLEATRIETVIGDAGFTHALGRDLETTVPLAWTALRALLRDREVRKHADVLRRCLREDEELLLVSKIWVPLPIPMNFRLAALAVTSRRLLWVYTPGLSKRKVRELRYERIIAARAERDLLSSAGGLSFKRKVIVSASHGGVEFLDLSRSAATGLAALINERVQERR